MHSHIVTVSVIQKPALSLMPKSVLLLIVVVVVVVLVLSLAPAPLHKAVVAVAVAVLGVDVFGVDDVIDVIL